MSSSNVTSSSESKLFKLLLALSALLHLTFILIDFNNIIRIKNQSNKEESISVDLSYLPDGTALENTSSKRMLPQLPKKFKLEEKSFSDESFKKEKDKRRLSEKKEIEKLKRVTLDRFRRELHRKNSKKADLTKKKKRIKLSKDLLSRRKSLEKSGKKVHISLASAKDSYASKLRFWILKNYTLPEIYKNKKIKTEILLTLNKTGSISTMTLDSSSGNTSFDLLAVETLENSSPFPPPPKPWVGKKIKLAFEPNLWGK